MAKSPGCPSPGDHFGTLREGVHDRAGTALCRLTLACVSGRSGGRVAGRLLDADKERVRDANRIDTVVGEYVTLRSAGGGNLKGLCPFHDEKTPSFQVRPALGRYHCFGCGVGGDVFGFLEAIEHLTFLEAVQRLAERANISLNFVEGGSSTRAERGTRARLLAAMKAAAAFYRAQLAGDEAAIARAFLAERGFELESAVGFGCGYAPSGWDRLTRELAGQGFSLDELTRAGLSKQGTRGPIDQFHRRLLWAIRDAAGEVIGFGARRLYDDDRLQAKYVNTAETPLYRKSQVLFGLDLAKRDIARQRRVVVVEGYTDVMAMHLAGVTTAVASCGTAFGDEHISVLRRYLLDADTSRGQVIYTFDGDAAGQQAALKAFDSDQRFSADTYVAVAPEGMDPCELRQARGDEAVRALVDTRRPLFEFAIRSLLSQHDLDTAEGRVAATRAGVPLVARIRDETLRDEYARRLAGWLGAEPAAVLGLVRERATNDRRDAARAAQRASAHPSAGGPAPAPPDRRAPHAPPAPQDRVASGDRGAPAGSGQSQERAPERPDDPTGRPEGARGATSGAGAAAGVPPRPDPTNRRTLVEREALKLVLQQPDTVGDGYQQVGRSAYSEPAYALVHDAVAAAGGPPVGAARSEWVDRVADELPAGPLRSLVTELAVETLRHRSDEPDGAYARQILARMAERVAAAQEGSLHSALQRAEADGDAVRARTVNADLMAVAAYRRALADLARGEV